MLEERGHIVEDADSNEEEKFVFHILPEAVLVMLYHRYGAVVRGSNAYIPPAARKQAAMGSTTAINTPKAEAPKIAVNGPDGAQIPTPPSKTSTPTPVAAPSATSQVPTNKVP